MSYSNSYKDKTSPIITATFHLNNIKIDLINGLIKDYYL